MFGENLFYFCGAKRRDGLHYVVPTKFPDKNSRLIPFVFSREQSYMMEFGDYYVRFFRDNGYVEDIGNVVSYLGDGTSSNFIYPYPATLEADIKVYDENGDLMTVTTDYTVTVIDNDLNYATPFTGWNLDYGTSTGDPWTLVGTEATSPVNSKTIMGIADLEVPVGGAYTSTVDITAFSYTDTVNTDTRTTDVVLVPLDPYVVIAEITAATETDNDGTIDYDFTCEDLLQTSDFEWEVRYNSAVIASGVELAVGAASRVQGTVQFTDHIYIGDTITIQVRAINNHPNSDPVIAAATQATVLTGTYVTNTDAKLEHDFVPFGDSIKWQLIDPVVGTVTLFDQDEVNYEPAPMENLYRAEHGLQITLDNPVFKVKTPGYIITFVTPPPLGSVRTMVDGSIDTEAFFRSFRADKVIPPNISHSVNALGFFDDVVARRFIRAAVQPDDIFEIQSPFSEEELEDLHFAQANDVMIFAIDSQKPWTLTRWNPYDWRFVQPTMTGAPWEDAQYNPLDGYPRTVCWFQERLYFGGTVAKPQTLWGSRAADFYDFDVPVDPDPILPDSPVEYTIAAYTHEAIEWLSSERVLVIGTSSTEHRLAPDQYIATDRLPTVRRMSAYGGAHVMPAFMGNLTVFVQASGASVRTFEQSTQTIIEKWDSIELDWMASHLTEAKVKQIGYALNHDSLLFMVTLDGDFLTMTYEPGMGETQEIGWGKHNTDGLFKSCAAMPEDEHDQIWAIVERDIEGVSARYVEFFDPEVFTDSTLTYPPDDGNNYPPLQSVGGLQHLEGKTVTIVGDGATHPDMTVQDGMVTLNDYYENIEIGLKYIPRIKLQKFAMASEPGDLQGQLGRWVEVWLRLVESAYPLVDGVRASERAAATQMDTAEPIVTSDVKVYNIGFDRNKQLVIEQDLPMPMHITAVFGTLEVNQG